MWLNKASALLLIAVFGFSWVQTSPAQHPRQDNDDPKIQANPGAISITVALSSIQAPIQGNENVPNEQGYPRRFDVNIGRHYILPFINSTIHDAHRFTLEEKSTIMTFIITGIQNLLTELKIRSDDLVYLLNTLIVKGEVTTLQRLSGMTHPTYQNRFMGLFGIIEAYQSNIAAIQDKLESYQTIDVWRTLLQKTQMTEELNSLYETVSSLSESDERLWKQFYWILNM